MALTKIEWTDYTFNPWIGCTKVSPGCKFCYAEYDQDKRRKRVKWGACGTRSVTRYEYWKDALKWNREAEISGIRKKVFCASLADVFESFNGLVTDKDGNLLFFPVYDKFEDIPVYLHGFDVDGIPAFNHYTADYIEKNYSSFRQFFKILTLDMIRIRLFRLIEKTPHLDWLLLTKRPENILKMVPENWLDSFPPNVWIGTSVEDQDAADARIPYLLQVPAAIHFLSCEPLLGPVNLRKITTTSEQMFGMKVGLSEKFSALDIEGDQGFENSIDWVIVGGESGDKARPMHPDWAREIRKQCYDADIAFFFKQWGEYAPHMLEKASSLKSVSHKGFGQDMCRVGKNIAGSLLDEREYKNFPAA